MFSLEGGGVDMTVEHIFGLKASNHIWTFGSPSILADAHISFQTLSTYSLLQRNTTQFKNRHAVAFINRSVELILKKEDL